MSSGVRVVLDTNAAVSGLLWGGPPGRLIDAALAGRIELATSAPLLAELQGVLARDKLSGQLAKRGRSALEIFEGYAALALVFKPTPIEPTIARDPDDDQVLAAAVAAEADWIVSGDLDLLELGGFRGILILTPSAAAARLDAQLQ